MRTLEYLITVHYLSNSVSSGLPRRTNQFTLNAPDVNGLTHFNFSIQNGKLVKILNKSCTDI